MAGLAPCRRNASWLSDAPCHRVGLRSDGVCSDDYHEFVELQTAEE